MSSPWICTYIKCMHSKEHANFEKVNDKYTVTYCSMNLLQSSFSKRAFPFWSKIYCAWWANHMGLVFVILKNYLTSIELVKYFWSPLISMWLESNSVPWSESNVEMEWNRLHPEIEVYKKLRNQTHWGGLPEGYHRGQYKQTNNKLPL